MSFATKAELAGLYIAAKEMVPLRHNLKYMVCPQPKMPLQNVNTNSIGINSFTTVSNRIKSMEMRLWWLRCRESQGQFQLY